MGLTSKIDITEHAKLRYRQRADPTEPYPAERIRDLLSRASPGAAEANEGIGWKAGDLVIVTDSAKQAVKTVLRATPGGRQ